MKARAIGYSSKKVEEYKGFSLSDLDAIKGETVWIDVSNPTTKDLAPLKDKYGFHHLALEDCVHQIQRPKVENYQDHVFIVSREIEYNKKITTSQLALFLGKNYVVTIHDEKSQSIETIWENLLDENPRLLSSGADFLAYSILDEVTDKYFVSLDNVEGRIEKIEDNVVKNPSKKTLKQIFQLKKDLLLFRKPIWPMREVYHTLASGNLPNIQDKTVPYYRDLYDHLIQVIDVIETYRELIGGALETYLSSLSNNTNEVMKVLTVIASLMLVPTLISGIYGMNFDTSISPYNMPELKWVFGYPFALGSMALTIIIMLVWFRKKRFI